jgi:hypothetical protein
MKKISEKEIRELKENSHRYHRLMSRHLKITGPLDTFFEDACKEIGRLQGIEDCLESIERIMEAR